MSSRSSNSSLWPNPNLCCVCLGNCVSGDVLDFLPTGLESEGIEWNGAVSILSESSPHCLECCLAKPLDIASKHLCRIGPIKFHGR